MATQIRGYVLESDAEFAGGDVRVMQAEEHEHGDCPQYVEVHGWNGGPGAALSPEQAIKAALWILEHYVVSAKSHV